MNHEELARPERFERPIPWFTTRDLADDEKLYVQIRDPPRYFSAGDPGPRIRMEKPAVLRPNLALRSHGKLHFELAVQQEAHVIRAANIQKCFRTHAHNLGGWLTNSS